MSGTTGRPRAWKLVRAGTIEPNATTVQQRAGTFAASMPDGTVLLTRREVDGLSHWLIAPNEVGVEQAALHLAQTVAARAEEVDDVEQLMGARHIALARFSPGSVVGRDTQAGAELQEISGRLASTLRSGEWVAAVLRQPSNAETKRYARWLQHQFGGARPTHHSLQQTAVVMSIWAGSESRSEAQSLLRQVTAAMPGFDVQIDAQPVSRVRVGSLITLGGAAGVVAAISAHNMSVHLGGAVAELAGATLTLGAAAVALGVAHLSGHTVSFTNIARRLMRENLLPEPGRRILPAARPRRERVNRDGTIEHASDGGYPMEDRAFMTGPQLPVGLVAPHAGAASGSSSTQVRLAPSSMRDVIGPLLGENDGRPVYLSASDLYAGADYPPPPGAPLRARSP